MARPRLGSPKFQKILAGCALQNEVAEPLAIRREDRLQGVPFGGNLAVTVRIVQQDGTLTHSNSSDHRAAVRVYRDPVFLCRPSCQLLGPTVRIPLAPEM